MAPLGALIDDVVTCNVLLIRKHSPQYTNRAIVSILRVQECAPNVSARARARARAGERAHTHAHTHRLYRVSLSAIRTHVMMIIRLSTSWINSIVLTPSSKKANVRFSAFAIE